jgi:hypothetical protein
MLQLSIIRMTNRRTFGDTAILRDSHGNVVSTNDMGMTFHTLYDSEIYKVIVQQEKYSHTCEIYTLKRLLFNKQNLITHLKHMNK